MTSDHRITPGLIHDILDALERHGYVRSDDLHAGRATGLIGDLARICEGTQDYPAVASPHHGAVIPAAQPGPGGQAAPDGVVPCPRRCSDRRGRAGHRRRRQARPR